MRQTVCLAIHRREGYRHEFAIGGTIELDGKAGAFRIDFGVHGDLVITADIPYTVDTGEKLVNETYGPGNIRRRRTGTLDWRPVPIREGPAAAAELSLERTGFVLVEHKTAVRDFFDRQELETVYYAEVERLIGE